MPDDKNSLRRRTYLKSTGSAGTVALAALAGCTLGGGGNDNGASGEGENGSGDGEDTTDTQQENDDGGDTSPITIAATVPETGTYSSGGEDIKRGYELGVEYMNQQLDRNVELILRDDESDAQTVREQLQQIVSNNDVNMVWGSFSSLLVTAGSAFAENQNLPFLGVAFAYEQPHREDNYEWTFSPFPKSRDMAQATLGTLQFIPDDNQPSNVGIWEPNSGWGQEMADYWEQTLSEAGYDIVLRETFEIGSSDFSTLISQSSSANVEVLLSNPVPGDGITAMNQMKSNNYAPKMLKFIRGADTRPWWSALGQDGTYALMCPGWVPGLTGNGNQRFRESYMQAYDIETETVPVLTGAAYNLTQVAHQAIASATSVDPDGLRSALQNEEFNTVIGTFSFDQSGMPAEGELTAPVGQWWEGAQRVVYPDTDSERAIDLKYPIPPWDER